MKIRKLASRASSVWCRCFRGIHTASKGRHSVGLGKTEGYLKSIALYVPRLIQAVLFGYNPNYPFPVIKGRERRGIIGGALALVSLVIDLVTSLVALVFVFLIFGLIFFPETARPLLADLKQATALGIRKENGAEVQPGVFVSFEGIEDTKTRELALSFIESDALKVRQLFGVDLGHPVVLTVYPTTWEGVEKQTAILGYYLPQSHKRWGSHSIDISLRGLFSSSVAAHELAHVYVDHLNPRLCLCLNEGVAHFVQGNLENAQHIEEEQVDQCRFPTLRHWTSESARSNTDKLAIRGLGYVVVHYLHQVKQIPIARIPLLAQSELPSLEEIHSHLRALKLRLAKDRALKKESGKIDLNFLQLAYLSNTGAGQLAPGGIPSSLPEAENSFQHIMDLSVQHLRWSGVPDADIAKMSPEQLMRLSEQAVSKLDSRLEQIGALVGEYLFLSNSEGIYDEGLERLMKDAYKDDRHGRLIRAIDQSWARTYASKKLADYDPKKGYSPNLLSAILEQTGPPSPGRQSLYKLEVLSKDADLKAPL